MPPYLVKDLELEACTSLDCYLRLLLELGIAASSVRIALLVVNVVRAFLTVTQSSQL